MYIYIYIYNLFFCIYICIYIYIYSSKLQSLFKTVFIEFQFTEPLQKIVSMIMQVCVCVLTDHPTKRSVSTNHPRHN